jgi:hypothetical protein
MNFRLILSLAVLGGALAGCTTMPKVGSGPGSPQADATSAPKGPVGHRLEDVMALNGPPSQQWDMPDGRKAYQWQSSSISATVAPTRKGEIKSAGVSQTTCFYTLYAKTDAKGVVKVVGAEEPRPGCMTLAMIGQAK